MTNNPPALAWAQRELKRRERAALSRVIFELREAQREVGPLIEAARKEKRERMRTNGPRGFVMVNRDADQ